MSYPTPIRLTATSIELDSAEFQEILAWQFDDADAFITELLVTDLRQRILFNHAQLWIYRNPVGEIVGFGSMELAEHYQELANQRCHPYIPLLAVKPNIQSRGYGTSIVRHLIDEAALLVLSDPSCSDLLFLEVYTTSVKAMALYAKCEFQNVTLSPLVDRDNGKLYFVMAKRISLAGTDLFNLTP